VEVARYFKRGDHGVSPLAWAEFTPCACSTHVAIHYGLRGPIATHSSGCVSGVDAMIWGVQQLRQGAADVIIAGGADAPFFPFIWAGFCRSGILAAIPEDGGPMPRPFSHDHNGIVLVEGGSAIVLEREDHARLRGARIYAEVLGVASVEEARPLYDLDPTGVAYANTIARTLHDAGQPVTAIDWLQAHGTGYPGADVAESLGIETALGEHAFRIPVSSIRGAVGQSFASGAGFQISGACAALREQRVPATLNFTQPAENCRLDYVPNTSRVARLNTVMVCTAGVGGTHAGSLLRKYDA
jgi:3-oxoacyl-(acyl-carrier-protein) synthase